MRRTKIVVTLGPATDEGDTVRGLLRAGLDAARLNLSHGTPDEHRRRLAALRREADRVGRHIPVLWDTKGPEARIGPMKEGSLLRPGDPFVLTTDPVTGNKDRAHIPLPSFPDLVRRGEEILLDDGRIVLRVEEVGQRDVLCRVVEGGPLLGHKKVSASGLTSGLPAVSRADEADFALGAELGAEIVAASFVRTAGHVLEIRERIASLGWRPMVLAKIETREAVSNIRSIVDVSDGIMLARGDLGLALPTEEMPIVQKELISLSRRLGKPVVTATQMLESMVDHPRPTRAEATDVANAILDGTDAVMLSEETAVGHHPVEAVAMMGRIAEVADRAVVERAAPPQGGGSSVGEAISSAIWRIARDVDAQAILSATQSGYTARMVARNRPEAVIIAATPDAWTARKLSLVWGVRPIVVPTATTTDEMMDRAIEGALGSGLVGEGDLVVLTAGVPVGVPGTTNLIQVQTLGEPLLSGQGIGSGVVRGSAHLAAEDGDALRLREGAVLVARRTTASMVPAIERAAAVITEEGGLTSHAALVGASLGKPVIVGAEGALQIVGEGDRIVVDARRGRVWRAQAAPPSPPESP